MNGYWIIGCTLAALFFGGITGWHERVLREPALLQAQRDTDTKECQKAKQITEDANNELQKNRDAIAAKLSAYRLRPTACVPIASKTDICPGGRQHARQNGIDSATLRDYAAECETYRSEFIVCNDVLDKERFGGN